MRLHLLLLLLLFSFTLFAQNEGASKVYSQIKIDLTTTELGKVASLGLEVDHGHWAKGKHLINVYSQDELALLAANNIAFEVLIPDAKADYLRRVREAHNHSHHHNHHHTHSRNGAECLSAGASSNYTTPANYTYGSMGGYLTYDELLAVLDSMVAKYPNLITPKMQIGESVSIEGRPIWHLRLSDNPLVDEDEPELLYTALHHAREPNSLAQMVFYIWYLLENYETDAEVKYLVDNTEMYFIPVVNPDGYLFNESTDPEGGGFWRKNRRDNGDGTFGVDLNRNYGFEWGFDDNGSSPSTGSETYRGTEGFSEPETAAVRDLCNQHNFRITLNYHTFGNLLIYPWGYSDTETPDQATFRSMTDVMTRENDYLAGTGTETVGYTVNGDSDDWMYGEEESKPKIFSMTPEVGPQFWPTQAEIDGLNKDCLLQNLTAAHLLLNYGEAEEVDGQTVLSSLNGSIDLRLKKYGLQAGTLTLTVTGLDETITMLGTNSFMANMEHLDEENFSFGYELDDQIESGTEVAFLVMVDNGLYTSVDTLKKTFGGNANPFQSIFLDNSSNESLWQGSGNGAWATTTAEFVSPPNSRTDSPGGGYDSGIMSAYTLNELVSLENMAEARLEFWAKWDIENDYDYVQIAISTDGANYEPLCGLYTNSGSDQQIEGEPLYDDVQEEWVKETIDLNEYLGQTVRFRFSFVSDDFVNADGFYFDDFEVLGLPLVNTVERNAANGVQIGTVVPNPFTEVLNISLVVDDAKTSFDLRLVDVLGRTVVRKQLGPVAIGQQQYNLPAANLTKGIYFLQAYSEGQLIGTIKVAKQ